MAANSGSLLPKGIQYYSVLLLLGQ